MKYEDTIVVGAYYKDENGNVLKVFRSDSNNNISYYYDDNSGARFIFENDALSKWERQTNLTAFPNAKDPVLPYVFDLLYDIKYTSELVKILKDYEKLKELALDYKIKLD